MKPSWRRKIIHIDMDAFFAAVEQRDRPELRGKPVIIGGDPASRSVVSTASYEARKFGVHSAMPASQARRLCPQGIFIHPNFEKYSAASAIVMDILARHTDLVEAVSIDEAYLDVTRHRLGLEDPVMIATLIKQNIFAVTQLTASAGVASNLFLAKVASDMNKPDGLTVVLPGQETAFLRGLSVRKIPGVGPVTEKELTAIGIRTCGELADHDVADLTKHFGKMGLFLAERAQGYDDREVEPYTEPKQYSTEETFAQDVLDTDWMLMKLRRYSAEVYEGLKESGRMGRTVVLKVKYHDFELITRSRTLAQPPADAEEIYRVASDLLIKKTLAGKKAVRLLGIGIAGLDRPAEDEHPDNRQKELFAAN